MAVIIRTSHRKETEGTARSRESRSKTGAGLFPEARPRGTTPRVGNRFIVADGQEARGDTAAPRLSGDTRDHATTRILAFGTRL
jgi:hypothetical protein